MYVKSAELAFRIHYATSLKDKRSVCRSLIDKVRQRFNVSIAEVATQDSHQILTIGVAVVSGNADHAQRSLDEVIRFIEENTDAELFDVSNCY